MLGGALRAPAATGDGAPAEGLRFLVGDVELTHALARVAERDANGGAFPFGNLDP